MTALQATDIARTILDIARQPQPDAPAATSDELRQRRLRPMVYMRYGEYDALLPDLDFAPGMQVVDFSSPQWLTFVLALRFPATQFTYTNVLDEELAPFEALARHHGMGNLRYLKVDLRQLPFDAAQFDRALSVSVIEHVFPEVGGDVAAMREIRRVLRPQGRLFMTVPFKAQRQVVYVNRPVYERGDEGRNFYAREYDDPQFRGLLAASGFEPQQLRYVVERPGLLALDALEWGPLKGTARSRWLLLTRRLAEKLTGRSLDAWLAERYLRVTSDPADRLVNVAATLRPAQDVGRAA